MKRTIQWLFEGGLRIYLAYMAAGFASIPGGLLWAYFTSRGHGDAAHVLIALALGLLCAIPAYRRVLAGPKYDPVGAW